MWRQPTSKARPTASAVSPGSIWKTPKPSCGISLPSLSLMFGMVMPLALPALQLRTRRARNGVGREPEALLQVLERRRHPEAAHRDHRARLPDIAVPAEVGGLLDAHPRGD